MKQIFYIDGNIEIVKNGQTFLNEKRVALLKHVKNKGSINAASKELKMSYQQAWHFIKEMNEISPLPLIVRQRGGSNGGGAIVTKHGQIAIKRYEDITSAHKKFKEKINATFDLFFFEQRYTVD